MSEIELLPCIRCGGEMAMHENDWADPPMWSAYCLAMETCGIHMPERLDRAEAIKVANFRSPPQVGRGMEEIIAFLMGSGSLDGVWFGDKHPTEKGAFWWRRRLRAALSAPSVSQGETATAEDAARLILECTDELISKATAEKLAERIRSLGTGSREERSQADLGERKMEKKR